MIALGLFPGAFIEKTSNCIVMQNQNSSSTIPIGKIVTDTVIQAEKSVKYVTVKCHGCGATTNIIAGNVGECEFCGLQISAN